jgi:hypothetical protein
VVVEFQERLGHADITDDPNAEGYVPTSSGVMHMPSSHFSPGAVHASSIVPLFTDVNCLRSFQSSHSFT